MKEIRVALSWDRLLQVFEYMRVNSSKSLLKKSLLRWGKVIKTNDNSIFVDVGLKTLAEYPKWFLKDYGVENIEFDKLPCYITKFIQKDGTIKLNQARLSYLIGKNLMFLSKFNKNVCFNAEIGTHKWKGCSIKILPHLINGEQKSFEIFMPVMNNDSSNKLEINNTIANSPIRIKKLNFISRNVTADVINVSKDYNSSYDSIKLREIVSGKIIKILNNGLIIDVKGLGCFLSISNIFYKSENKDLRSLFQIGQILNNLVVVKKYPEEKKIYLNSRDTTDSLKNYFKQGEEFEAEVAAVKGRYILIKVKDINIWANLKDITWKNSRLFNEKKIKVTFNFEKGYFESKEKLEDSYWTKLPESLSIGSKLDLQIDSIKNDLITYKSESNDYIIGTNLKKKINRVLKQFDKFYNFEQSIEAYVDKHNTEIGMIEVLPRNIYIRKRILTLPRAIIDAKILEIKKNRIIVEVLDGLLTEEIVVQSIKSFINLVIGSKIQVAIKSVNLRNPSLKLTIL